MEGKALVATSGPKTDFWRETHYGFIRDDGHVLAFKAPENFTAEVEISGDFSELYDQAGLMLRVSARQWVKAGAEFTDGALRLSTVVTSGRSDWSVSRSLGGKRRFSVRLTLKDNALRVQAKSADQPWDLIRLAPFEASPDMIVGPMFCTPTRAGLTVRMEQFKLGPPIATDLHDND